MEWKIAYAHDEICRGREFTTMESLENAGFDIIPAEVPGNFELDLMRAGKLDDLYYSTNTLQAQLLEDVHVWYFTQVQLEEGQYLQFNGIDTFADIYVNGKLVQSTANMSLPYAVHNGWIKGTNEVVVHIRPTMLEARKYEIPAGCHALKYNYPSLYVRKAAHMFGWDIMPRIVSAGIWKSVEVKQEKKDEIQEVYLSVNTLDPEKKTASLRFFMRAKLEGTRAQEYRIRLEGTCGDHTYSKEEQLWHTIQAFVLNLEDCRFWWPKRAGEQNLYDVTVTLLRGENVCDVYKMKHGIRTVVLDRTESTDEQASGEFCFKVNGKKIFVLGTNWVPLDAFHSQDSKRLPRALELLDDIGCNMVRCWGGNVYESDEFYDFCDEHGILIWQDFAMGCGVYPDDEILAASLREEAVYQIRCLRNHASLALWAGDNECDAAAKDGWSGYPTDPNRNRLTRDVLRRAVEMHDFTHSYLPSSPYVSEAVWRGEGIMPENHLWGPRDYFKGNFYKNTFCHFASETGYHAFNSPESLKKFLKHPEKIFTEAGSPTDEYLVHAASMECDPQAPYAFRIRLAYDQVVTLFGKAEEDLHAFIKQSQISQAEAKKYFIEKFRIGKWDRTGIIWWNLVDGWPQVSDAVVDYYFVKKLAYHYIKRSQEPVCLMFDEPVDGRIRLVGVNDLPEDSVVTYTVKKLVPQKNAVKEEVVLQGQVLLPADQSVTVDLHPIEAEEKNFYLIQWKVGEKSFMNHYVTNIIDISYQDYLCCMEYCGMDRFEGFR